MTTITFSLLILAMLADTRLTAAQIKAIHAIEHVDAGPSGTGAVEKNEKGVPIGIYLTHAKIDDDFLKYVGVFSQADFVDLSFAKNVTGNGLRHVKGMKKLRTLMLFGTKVNDDGLENLKNMKSLESLSLCRTKITDDGMKHLKGMTWLEYLDLGETQITDKGLQQLHGLTDLKRITLSKTKITEKGIAAIKKALPELEIVNISSEHDEP